jgi:Family of unknown function (DUF5367)
MNKRLFMYGVLGWIVASAALREAGQYLLPSSEWNRVLVLYAVLMAWLARRLLITLGIGPAQVLGGVVSLLLPTLLLDPFSSAFFPAVFPNMAREMAGAFAGWMLISCAGALVGGMMYRAKATA